LNLRPLGYEPNELPGCSTPQIHSIANDYAGSNGAWVCMKRKSVSDLEMRPISSPMPRVAYTNAVFHGDKILIMTDSLCMVDPRVSGEEVTHNACNSNKGTSFRAEKIHCHKSRCDGSVSRASKDGY
jgi:hypothetical protein